MWGDESPGTEHPRIPRGVCNTRETRRETSKIQDSRRVVQEERVRSSRALSRIIGTERFTEIGGRDLPTRKVTQRYQSISASRCRGRDFSRLTRERFGE